MGTPRGDRVAPPQNNVWYPLQLGSTFLGESSTEYYTLRYEFKPASVNPAKPGVMRRGREKKEVAVELPNIQAGKPNVAFQGHRELCQEQEAIVFFDGEGLRLERLHHSVKSLKVVRGNAKMGGEGGGLGMAAMDSQASPMEREGGEGGGGGGGRTTPAATPPRALEVLETEEDILNQALESSGVLDGTKKPVLGKGHISKAKLPSMTKKRKGGEGGGGGDFPSKTSKEPSPSPTQPSPSPLKPSPSPFKPSPSPIKPSPSPSSKYSPYEETQQFKKPRPEDIETLDLGVEEEVVEYYETETDEEDTQEGKGGKEEGGVRGEDGGGGRGGGGGGGDGGEDRGSGERGGGGRGNVSAAQAAAGVNSSSDSSSGSSSGSEGSTSGSGSSDEESASSGDDVVE